MILRSRFQKPSEVKIRKRQMGWGKNKQKKSTASRIPVDQETMRKNQNLKKSSSQCEAYQHYDRKKCYILTRDSKTLRFDLDEHGHRKISIEDSQSIEDIAWLDIFTSNKQNTCALVARNSTKKRCKNLVTMTQRSKNNFLLLGKNKKQLYLKVLNPNGKASRGRIVAGCSMEVITGGAPDPRQLTEKENQLFIMHYNQEDSVRFQCYKDQNYYLHVNKDSVDLCKMKETDADTGKDFYFKVAYV
ncbi:Calpain-13 [Platysternon megacephalum]|uniref:Calpain-13 n=1 Tax=Platysternon megacephalum TaxID=55544 RepID=A0A4D9EX29_9SAUR|nr:Calpain-13 [Platysternon megacephalum]